MHFTKAVLPPGLGVRVHFHALQFQEMALALIDAGQTSILACGISDGLSVPHIFTVVCGGSIKNVYPIAPKRLMFIFPLHVPANGAGFGVGWTCDFGNVVWVDRFGFGFAGCCRAGFGLSRTSWIGAGSRCWVIKSNAASSDKIRAQRELGNFMAKISRRFPVRP